MLSVTEQSSTLPKTQGIFPCSQEVPVGKVKIGGNRFVVMAGPCSIESLGQLDLTAQFVKSQGAAILRGGIYKMRTRPDAFQGLGLEAYEIVREIRNRYHMPIVAEVTDPRQLEGLDDVVDLLQVGARNMYNYELLKELGYLNKPVLLKRGLSAYVDEWLSAAEYITRGGNQNVIFCERGIRTYEKATRNTLDMAVVPYIKTRSHLPVIVDPSHGTGVRDLIPAMCWAAAAAGADGLLVEVHPDPDNAASDGPQSLSLPMFEGMMTTLKRVLNAVGKPLETADEG